MDLEKFSSELKDIINRTDLSNYLSTKKVLEEACKKIKEDEDGDFVDFITSSGVKFRVHKNSDGSINRIHFNIRKDDIEELDRDAFYELSKEYYSEWKRLTQDMTNIFGKPKYSDGFGNKGYPEDTEAQWISLWNLPNARLTLEVHDGYDIIPQYLAVIYGLTN